MHPYSLLGLVFLLALCFFVNACANPGIKSPATKLSSAELEARLQAKFESYAGLILEHQDRYGFIDTEHCDALLFSGLVGTVPGIEVDITAARDSEGRWHRRPIDRPCYPNGSKSTISRDMFMGLLWYIWRHKRLDLAEELYTYGEAHDWIMGEGDITRIYFTPGLQATLAELIFRLGGKDRPIIRSLPHTFTTNEGFAAHLDVLHILLLAELRSQIPLTHFNLLAHHAKRSPHNALFQFAYHKFSDGNYETALKILLNEKWFPSHSLPTNHDRKEFWLWQRDYGADWLPDLNSPITTHSGGDFLFLAHLILEGT